MAHDRRHVSIYFHSCQGGWFCKFLEVDLMTGLPKHLCFPSNEKLVEAAERGSERPTQGSRLRLTDDIRKDCGGVYLNLTIEPYGRLRDIAGGAAK